MLDLRIDRGRQVGSQDLIILRSKGRAGCRENAEVLRPNGGKSSANCTAGCVEVSTSSWNGNGYYDCFGRRGHRAQAFLLGVTGRKLALAQLPSSGANQDEGAE